MMLNEASGQQFVSGCVAVIALLWRVQEYIDWASFWSVLTCLALAGICSSLSCREERRV